MKYKSVYLEALAMFLVKISLPHPDSPKKEQIKRKSECAYQNKYVLE